MSLKSKAKAAKQRAHKQRMAEQEVQATATKAVKLKTAVAGFARTGRTADIVRAHEQAKMPKYRQRTEVNHTEDRFPKHKDKPIVSLSDDMRKREQAALEKTKEYKARVGPAFNKGGYQLLDEGVLAAEKKGELRRRS
jgi:hypothetical protein